MKVVQTQAEAEALAGAKTPDRIHALYLPEHKNIALVADNLNMGTVRQKLRHELIHHALEHLITPSEQTSLIKILNETRNSRSPEIKEIWGIIDKNYAGSSKEVHAAEFLAHMAERYSARKYGIYWDRALNAIKTLLHKAGLISSDGFKDLHQLKEILYTLSQRLRTEGSSARARGEAGTAHSRQARPDPFKVPEGEGERYRAELDKAMRSRRTGGITIQITRTPSVLRHSGAPDLPLIITRDTVRKATNGVKHVVPMDVIERLPGLIHDPEVVYRSATQDKSMLILLNAVDKKGDPVVSALNLQTSNKGIEINRIASVYGTTGGVNKVNSMDKAGLALYKKQNPDINRRGGLQLPGESDNQGSGKRMLHPEDIRKMENEIFFSKSTFSEFEPEHTYISSCRWSSLFVCYL